MKPPKPMKLLNLSLILLTVICAQAQKREQIRDNFLLKISDTLTYSKDSIATLKIELTNITSSEILVVNNDVENITYIDQSIMVIDIKNGITDPFLMPKFRQACFVIGPKEKITISKTSKFRSKIITSLIQLNAFRLESFPKNVQNHIKKKRIGSDSKILLKELCKKQLEDLGEVSFKITYD